jgi:hypothetical protein
LQGVDDKAKGASTREEGRREGERERERVTRDNGKLSERCLRKMATFATRCARSAKESPQQGLPRAPMLLRWATQRRWTLSTWKQTARGIPAQKYSKVT